MTLNRLLGTGRPTCLVVRLVAASLVLILAVSCTKTRKDTVQTAADAIPLPAQPLVRELPEVGTRGGRFVYGQTINPKTFNAMMANETSSTDITDLAFVGLAGFDKITQTESPEIAASWEVSPDDLTWTFHLRDGARFSDGHPITSEDVLFSFEVAYDETLHPSVQDLVMMDGKKFEISAPDAKTVVIRSPSPNAMMVSLAGSVKIMPKHVLEPERHVRLSLYGQHATRSDRHQWRLGHQAVRGGGKDGPRAKPVLVPRRSEEQPAPLPE